MTFPQRVSANSAWPHHFDSDFFSSVNASNSFAFLQDIRNDVEAPGSLSGRVSPTFVFASSCPDAEKEDLLKALRDWNPDCLEIELNFIKENIMECFLSDSNHLTLNLREIRTLPNIFSSNHFKKLQSLSLEFTALTALPEDICAMQNLSRVALKGASLRSLPEGFGNLSNLSQLDLSKTGLTTLPESIGNLSNLKEMNLRDCSNLVSLPRSLGRLIRLRELNLYNCTSLASLPETIGGLSALRKLSFYNCTSLVSLPDGISSLSNLKKLSLFNCRSLVALPRNIGSLSALRKLNLERCVFLTSLPNSILNLNSSCIVNLTDVTLSEAVRRRLTETTSDENYHGPQINFFAPTIPLVLSNTHTWNETVRAIYTYARMELQLLPNLLALDESDKEKIKMWLIRMSDTADGNAGTKTDFYKTIVSYLQLADENSEFRGVFLRILDDATSTCGDRVALSILHLGIEHKKLMLDKSDLKVLAELLKGLKSLELLEQIAREKAETLPYVDEIEVFLAYPIKLKDELNLPIDLDNMLYFARSGVTSEDLRLAKEFVLSVVTNQDVLLAGFVMNEDWINALKAKYPAKFATIQEAKEKASEIEEPDYETIGRAYEQALVELSREALA